MRAKHRRCAARIELLEEDEKVAMMAAARLMTKEGRSGSGSDPG